MKLAFTMCILLTCVSTAAGDAFLEASSRPSSPDHDQAFREAVGAVVGCGGDFDGGRLSEIENVLAPMWRAVPKNGLGRVEWKMLRYIAHRYFISQSALLIRGFEPTRAVNLSDFGAAGVLNHRAPGLVEMMLGGKNEDGFSLEDAVSVVAALEKLILDGEGSLLEKAYNQMRLPANGELEHDELARIIEAYIVLWFVEGNEKTTRIVLRNRTLLKQVIPQWDALSHFAKGVVKSFEYSRHSDPKPGHGRVAMTHKYSFGEAHEMVGSITKNFASFWEEQCQEIKSNLVALDRTNTGRVKLSDFYGANSDGEWRFGESEAYLRELGALDETSSWRGSQVIIPNYLLGASNCIITTSTYLVCCVNECEGILNEIEDTVRAPSAQPDEILRIVSNMSSFEDASPKIDKALRAHLEKLAATHGGRVPLHGRLFSQWLHYVFPRECPFPHKAGTASSAALSDFGDQAIASDQEVRSFAADRTNHDSAKIESIESEQWMSQWSEEEELVVDYNFHAPWERGCSWASGLAVVAVVVLMAGALKGSAKSNAGNVVRPSGLDVGKSHFV